MAQRTVLGGSADQSCVIYIFDSTDGTPETGVTFETAGIDLWYWRPGSTKTSITEATLATLDAAHSDGGIISISNGSYRLDLPDAAVAAGVSYVEVGGTITGMIIIGATLQIVAYNPADGVRLGLTALPNAAADAAGGLPISDDGGLDVDEILARIGSPVALDGGSATLGAMLTKMADDNGGADFDASTDSLQEIRDNQAGADAAAIADAVWDEAATGHTDAGKAGAQLWTDIDAIAGDVANIDGAAMRGTDNAALASVLGALATAAGTGDPDSAKTLMGYVKQLINVLVGTAGIASFPAEAAPANAVSLSEVIRAIHADVTGLNGSAMRGTDSAALASVLGALTTAAATGDPTTAKTAMGYIKQLVNILVGTEGIASFPAEAAPGNAVSLSEVIRAIHADVTGVAGSSIPTAANVVDEFETQSQADPTGFHVNVLEVNGTAQTANDNGADINAILTDTDELQTDDIPGAISGLNDPSAADIADAVWDEASTGHVDAGKAGQQLWTDVDAILTDSNELQTDDVPGLIAALENASLGDIADAIWDEAIADHRSAGSFGLYIAKGHPKNTAWNNHTFAMVDSTDNVTPKTGLTLTAEVLKDDGAFAAIAGTTTEESAGIYRLQATAADMNADTLIFKFTATGASASFVVVETC